MFREHNYIAFCILYGTIGLLTWLKGGVTVLAHPLAYWAIGPSRAYSARCWPCRLADCR